MSGSGINLTKEEIMNMPVFTSIKELIFISHFWNFYDGSFLDRFINLGLLSIEKDGIDIDFALLEPIFRLTSLTIKYDR